MSWLSEPITVHLPSLRTMTESNTGGTWIRKHLRAKQQRRITYLTLRQALPQAPPALPLSVTITRIAARALDSHDNIASACKHVVDGVSDYLAGAFLTGQDRQDGLTWQYAQRRGAAREYAVDITFTPGSKG